MMGMEPTGVLIDEVLCDVLGTLCVGVNERQQALGQHGKVPVHDPRLIGPGIAALPVDRTEAGLWIKVIHEGAGAIVDGFAAQQGVVGVEHTVHKAQDLPVADQLGEVITNTVE